MEFSKLTQVSGKRHIPNFWRRLNYLHAQVLYNLSKYPEPDKLHLSYLHTIYPKHIVIQLKGLVITLGHIAGVRAKRVKVVTGTKPIHTIAITGGYREVDTAAYFIRYVISYYYSYIERTRKTEQHIAKHNRKARRYGHVLWREAKPTKARELKKTLLLRIIGMLTKLEEHTPDIYPEAFLIRKEKLRYLRNNIKNLRAWQKIPR